MAHDETTCQPPSNLPWTPEASAVLDWLLAIEQTLVTLDSQVQAAKTVLEAEVL